MGITPLDPKVGTEEWARRISRPYTNHWNKAPHDPRQCCASVHDSGMGVSFHQCSRKPKVHYGSVGYCKQHDPAYIVEKNRLWNEKWERERKERNEADRVAKLKRGFHTEAVNLINEISIGHNDPRSACSDLLAKYAEVLPTPDTKTHE